jgi:hypothetical protein
MSSRRNKQHNGLAIRHPALRNIDSMELVAVAEAEVQDTLDLYRVPSLVSASPLCSFAMLSLGKRHAISTQFRHLLKTKDL